MSFFSRCTIFIFATTLGSTVTTTTALGGSETDESRPARVQASFVQSFELFSDICLEGLPDFRRSKEYASKKYGASFDGRKDRTWHPLDSESFINSITISKGHECIIYVDFNDNNDRSAEEFRALISDLPDTGVFYIQAGQEGDLDQLEKWQYMFSSSKNSSFRMLKEYSYKSTLLGVSRTLILSVKYRRFDCTVTQNQLELMGLTGEPPRDGILLSHAERWC
ncbi:hypothetical protein [Ruegeria halocynthiae]|uniref:hypothetical protein n=1 Tax=Ruegeria halocynthiae TaxID=985054 RepID=UPI0012686126|nr:hypothetical protein [Ruegeria halocynthiae]